MDYGLDTDQVALRDVVTQLLDRHAGSDQVRAAADLPSGYAGDLWRRLTAELGLSALAVPEAAGGAGASFLEVAVVLEQLGARLVPSPYLPTVVAVELLRHRADDAGWLDRVAAGQPLAVVAGDAASLTVGSDGPGTRLHGLAPHVLWGAAAAGYVVEAEHDGRSRLFVVDATSEGVQVEERVVLDQTCRQAAVRFTGALATGVGEGGVGAADVLRTALAVEATGAAGQLLATTVRYLGEREQFGRPIGSFQALKHRVADVAVAVEAARAVAAHAVWCVAADQAELPVAAAVAKAVCGEALVLAAHEAVQLHGGIAITWEHDAHLYLKRAKAIGALQGSARQNRRRAAALAGALGSPQQPV